MQSPVSQLRLLAVTNYEGFVGKEEDRQADREIITNRSKR
jgi:hypothetical protein